jgi:peptidoglycan/xylan/chitin deacetylase (PgdA/CDA1 family)
MSTSRFSIRAKALLSVGATIALVAAMWAFWPRGGPRRHLAEASETRALPTVANATPHAAPKGGRLDCIVVRAAPNLHSIEQARTMAERLARQGVQRVWVQFKQDESDEFTGGETFYPGKIAPVAEGFEDGRLRVFLEALKERGIKAAAWVPAFHDPTAWAAHPGWRAHWINVDGRSEEQNAWLCPGNAEAVAYEASLLGEILREFQGLISGIYTDFIRFDDDFSCGCPGCLERFARHTGVAGISPAQVREAAAARSPLWKEWIELRGDIIKDALDAMRDVIDESAPDFWFGASVLPFSALDYSFNTQSGQDLSKMCLAGVDEIVLMGYWDDWDKSPDWLRASLEHATRLTDGEAKLSCLLDGDMSIRRTMKTLDVLRGLECGTGWFNYGEWTDEVAGALHQARAQLAAFGGMPRSEATSVCIRIDTEPDSKRSYEDVNPSMIARLLDLFAEEGVKVTWITVGKIAEQQTDILRRAVAEGHEIGGHGYDHEQIDGLPEEEQRLVIDRTMDALQRTGFQPKGFGAPRNSITDIARDRLIERGFLYDGSAAYDPMESYLDPQFARHGTTGDSGILVIPFIIPNDWDARYLAGLSGPEMLGEWTRRLDKVSGDGEPVFVLDIHQWIAAQDENFEAVRGFIHAVKRRPNCRIRTMEAAAHHILAEIARAEGAAPWIDKGGR